MSTLDFNRDEIVELVDRIVEKTFEVDYTWDWPAGVAFYGVGLAYQALKKERYLELLKNWIDEYIEFGLPPITVNSSSMGHTLLTLYLETGEEKYLELAKKKADFLVSEAEKFGEIGILEHTVGGKVLFPEQAWIDTIFMSALFLVRMGHALANQTYMAEGIRQFKGHEFYLQDQQTQLYYHGWDNIKQNHMSGIFWARGNAWAAYSMSAALGLVDVKEPIFMEMASSLRDQLSALMNLQSENGLWHTVLLDPQSYEETSGSSGIAAALALRGHGTPKSFKALQKALDGLIKKVDENGVVCDVSTGTAVMNTTEGYINTSKKRIEGWGQGLALVFFAHLLMKE